MQFVALDSIRTDGGTQPRASLFEETVAAYVEDMNRGDAFPPITVFFDGQDYWLADGFHRFAAAKARGSSGLQADVRQGTQRDAILFSVGANADHGRARTNEDKRRAVLRLLNDPEWAAWSDREIARHCRVSPPLVATLRPAVTVNSYSEPAERIFTTRHGTTATMNTGSIGRRPEPAPEPRPTAPPPRPLPPMTQPEAATVRERAFAPAREDMDQGGPIYDAIEAIKTAFQRLPTASEAARRYPSTLRHTFSASQARHIAAWLNDLADAWEQPKGDADVIAAE